MLKVLTAAEMREVDRLTTERYGIPSIVLMENAAHAVARVITEKLGGSVTGKSILILCGPGNNGGDGAALGRVLSIAGANVDVILIGNPKKTSGDARINFDACSELSTGKNLAFSYGSDYGEVFQLIARHAEQVACVVDAIFGTGLSKPIDENAFAILNGFTHPLKVAIDLPSGLFADKASASPFQYSSGVTVTFTAPKPANILPPASNFNGELVVAHIGSPQELIDQQPSQLFLTETDDVGEWLNRSEFSNSSYKNRRGHALIIAGSENYSGAAVLAGNAAIRSGVGLVTIATPRSSKDGIVSRVAPEVMVRPVSETEIGAVSEAAIPEVEEFLKNVDAGAIGSGLSAKDESTAAFVRHFVENRRMPTLLDADALTLMSPMPAHEQGRNEIAPPLILTPHEGEFRKLLGVEKDEAEEILKDRVRAVRDFATSRNVILVLKGEQVMIGEPGGKVVVNPTGNSGLGKAGNGDTLTGLLAGFLAQAAQMKIDIFETVVAACYLAGLAGDIAKKKYGKRVMTASDVRECLAEAFEMVGKAAR